MMMVVVVVISMVQLSRVATVDILRPYIVTFTLKVQNLKATRMKNSFQGHKWDSQDQVRQFESRLGLFNCHIGIHIIQDY